MKKNNSMFFLHIYSLLQLHFRQDKKVYDDGYLVKVGDIMPDFAINEAGGKII